jgi:peptidylprolyl isomerase
VAALNDDTVKLDGNHPLAGKDLIFDIELLEIV